MVLTAGHLAPIVSLIAGILILDHAEAAELHRRHLPHLGGLDRAQRHLSFRELIIAGIEANLLQIGEAELMRGDLRYIDYSSGDERAAIGDPHDCRTAVFSIFDLDHGFERSERCAAVKFLARYLLRLLRLE